MPLALHEASRELVDRACDYAQRLLDSCHETSMVRAGRKAPGLLVALPRKPE